MRCSLQNVEPVLRACPELQKLNLASCRMLGENALDALLPAASGGPQMLNQIQVIPLICTFTRAISISALAWTGRIYSQHVRLHLDVCISLLTAVF